jgi:secreted trypsin-like serine protease
MGPSECGHPDYPAIYTKVSAVGNWIIHLCRAQIIPKVITKSDEIS